jgi:hypothetical protein
MEWQFHYIQLLLNLPIFSQSSEYNFISYFSHCYDKIPDINNLRKDWFILAHGSRYFGIFDSVNSGLAVRQNIMVAGVCGCEICLTVGSREEERERQEGARDKMPLTTCPQWFIFPNETLFSKVSRTSQNSITN